MCDILIRGVKKLKQKRFVKLIRALPNKKASDIKRCISFMKTYNGFISYSDLIKAIRFVDWNIDTAIDFITINVMQQSIANFNKRMGKEKVTKERQFPSD